MVQVVLYLLVVWAKIQDSAVSKRYNGPLGTFILFCKPVRDSVNKTMFNL